MIFRFVEETVRMNIMAAVINTTATAAGEE